MDRRPVLVQVRASRDGTIGKVPNVQWRDRELNYASCAATDRSGPFQLLGDFRHPRRQSRLVFYVATFARHLNMDQALGMGHYAAREL